MTPPYRVLPPDETFRLEWQYENVSVAVGDVPEDFFSRALNEVMNARGRAGWELVSVIRAEGDDGRFSYRLFFKRLV